MLEVGLEASQMAYRMGQRVVWYREGREPVLGIVVQVTPVRIQIQSSRADGEVILPWVYPEWLETAEAVSG